MEVKYVDSNNIENLEAYAVALTLGMMSMQTLANYHSCAVDKGILSDDLIQRAKVIMFDMIRAIKLYGAQLEEVLEMLPDDFNVEVALEGFKAQRTNPK